MSVSRVLTRDMSNTNTARTYPFSFLEAAACRINVGRGNVSDFALLAEGYFYCDDRRGYYHPNRNMVTQVAA